MLRRTIRFRSHQLRWLMSALPALLTTASFTHAAELEIDGSGTQATTSLPAIESADSVTGLKFSVSATGTERPWVLRIDNPTDQPVQVINDTRLLWFEVKVPGVRAPRSCRLPDEMVPVKLRRRAYQVLPAGGLLLRQFDPRLYCFSSGVQTTLVPGAQLTPHFGWPDRTKTSWQRGRKVTVILEPEPPFVAETLDATLSEPLAGVRHLSAAPLALGSEYQAWSNPGADSKERPLALQMVGGSDATSERDVSVRLALQNHSSDAVYLYYRRDLTHFVVQGPDGPTACLPQGPQLRSPDPQQLLRLSASEKIEVPIRLVEICPRGTFDRPGLYYVHAKIEAPAVDLPERNVFVGQVHSPAPALVRVRTGEQPFLLTPRGRPRDVVAPAEVINSNLSEPSVEPAAPDPSGADAAPAPQLPVPTDGAAR